MKGLTPKQHELLQFIQTYIDRHHYSPSYREIMDHFEFNSPASVYKHIKMLKRKGVLTASKNSHRSIKPVEGALKPINPSNDLRLPLIGNLAAGYPLELFVHSQNMTVPSSLVHHPDRTYILQVRGEGFQEERIQEGDLLLIEARQEIQPGEIILGLINQTDTILKRYYPEGQYIRLEHHYTQTSSLTVRSEHISIQGVLIGLIRTF